MRMNAETMKRNGEVYSTCRQLLSDKQPATVEMIVLVLGYSERDVEKALASLQSQGVVEMDLGVVSSVHPFPSA